MLLPYNLYQVFFIYFENFFYWEIYMFRNWKVINNYGITINLQCIVLRIQSDLLIKSYTQDKKHVGTCKKNLVYNLACWESSWPVLSSTMPLVGSTTPSPWSSPPPSLSEDFVRSRLVPKMMCSEWPSPPSRLGTCCWYAESEKGK